MLCFARVGHTLCNIATLQVAVAKWPNCRQCANDNNNNHIDLLLQLQQHLDSPIRDLKKAEQEEKRWQAVRHICGNLEGEQQRDLGILRVQAACQPQPQSNHNKSDNDISSNKNNNNKSDNESDNLWLPQHKWSRLKRQLKRAKLRLSLSQQLRQPPQTMNC